MSSSVSRATTAWLRTYVERALVDMVNRGCLYPELPNEQLVTMSTRVNVASGERLPASFIGADPHRPLRGRSGLHRPSRPRQ